ncbi:unnamed protein product [Linum tenue]|uniref:Uncharacterized protein n=1 Tax=Linum tenue TaxID=586396 RepID=A0AAV0LRM7_9ROSI|nr:unnamed protein product [Linum tenue]
MTSESGCWGHVTNSCLGSVQIYGEPLCSIAL